MQTAIAEDDALRQAVEDFPIAKMITESLIEDEVRGILAESKGAEGTIVKSIHTPRKKDGSKWGPWIIAATLLSALWVSHYQWERQNQLEVIWAQVMETYTPPDTNGTRSNTSAKNELDEAIRLFDLRKYSESKNLLKSLRPKSDTIYFYLTHIALIQKDIRSSKKNFKKIKNVELQEKLTKYISHF